MIIQVVAYTTLIILRLRMKKTLKDPCTEEEWRKQRRRIEFVGLDLNSTYSVPMDDGSGLYHFKLNEHVDWAKYTLTFSGFLISFVYMFR